VIAYGMLYAAAVGLPILLAALAGSTALRRYGKPERGVWLVALGLALTLPVAFLANPVGGSSSETAESLGGAEGASEALIETGLLGLPAVVAVPVEESTLGLDEILAFAWLLASALLALRWVVAAKRLSRVGASWQPRAVDGIRVWQTPDLGPAVSGVFRTRILVPSWLMSFPERQRSLVLLHEEEHVRARDPVLMAVARLARIVAPWNPMVWLMTSRLLHALELDCDRRVLGRRPDIETYGDTLLTVSARDSRPLIAAAAFTESHVGLRKRIVAMTTPPRTLSALGISTALALGAVLLMGSCEVPIPTVVDSEVEPDVVEASQNVLEIWLEPDGTVLIAGTPHTIEEVSEVVGPLYSASERKLIVLIAGDEATPYETIHQLQNELVAAGVVRVVFQRPESTPSPSTSEVSDEAGLRVVLPGGNGPARPVTGEPGPGEVQVSIKNVLHLIVQPSGVVDVKRGANPNPERLRPQDVEALWRLEVAKNPNLIAAVKTHPEAPYSFMAEVLAALQAAGSQRISLQVLQTR
jgi:beta-lactamase regulating signal transducer with metallopeptidase domain/biopolymer transport protein ExbD